MSDVVEIPPDLFVPDQYLDNYTKYLISDLDSIEDQFTSYKITNPKYDYKQQEFKIVIYFKIYGNTRTRVFEQVLLDEMIRILRYQEEKIEEKYGEDDDNWLVKEENEYKEIKRYELEFMLIKPVNSWYGKGFDLEILKIVNNNLYYIIFTKSTSECLSIASIKSQELDKMNCSAEQLKNHPLLNKNFRYKDKKSRITKYYNKEIILVKNENDLSLYSEEEYKSNIILFTSNMHIGCVYFNYIPNITIKNKQEIINYNKNMIKNEKVDIKALVWWDFEFEFDNRSPIEDELRLTSKEPNLIHICVDFDDGRNEELVYKNVREAISFLKALSNKGLVYVYSVNGSKIEHQFTLKSLIKDFKQGQQNKKSQTKYECKNNHGSKLKSLSYGNLKFIDLTLIIPKSVEEMSKIFKTSTPKGHQEWETLEKTKKVWNENLNTWELVFDKDKWYKNKIWNYKNKLDVEYTANDNRIPRETSYKFNSILCTYIEPQKYYFRGTPWLLAATSISSIGKKIILNKYPYICNDPRERAIFQPSYKGGKCEMFYKGYLKSDENFSIVQTDANSYYPSIACRDDLPELVVDQANTFPDKKETKIWLSYCYVTYKKDFVKPPIGLIKEGKFIFPNISKPTLLPLWSYTYNYKPNNFIIHKVIKTIYFSSFSMKELFECWYTKKLNAKSKGEAEVYKLQYNGSLGGLGLKIVQDGRIYTNDPDVVSKDDKISDYFLTKTFDDLFVMSYDKLINAKTSFHVIGAITEIGRIGLLTKFKELTKIGQVLWTYCDTDALHLYCDNKVKLHIKNNSNNQLGGWDFNEYEVAYYKGLKCYALDNKVTFKGIHQQDLRYLSMLHLTNETLELNGVRWIINSNSINIKDMKFVFVSDYKKGLVNKYGNVTPLKI